jgi:putative aminopeptidase FrvX
MTDLKETLKKLISLPGLSGYEAPAREVIEAAWLPMVDQVSVSPLGSLHALRRGSGPEPRPSILLAAHMDAIGLMVTGIQDGLLRFTEVGGVDPRILPGLRVSVHGRKDLPAVVVQPTDYLLEPSQRGKSVAMDYLFIDTGLEGKEVDEIVRVGDLVSFAQEPLELSGRTIVGHSLDNRISVAAITYCLQELQHMNHKWDVWAVATVQEEETLGGGFTSPFELNPTIAVAIDVTFGKGPGANDWRTVSLSKGPTLGWGPNAHPYVHKKFLEVAEELEIPFQKEYIPRHSGTDAYAMQVVAGGYPTMVIGIPLRYMHTPVEMIAMKDMERAGRLLAETIVRLEVDFMDNITWDEVMDEE